MPGYSGTRSRSAAARIGTMRATRNRRSACAAALRFPRRSSRRITRSPTAACRSRAAHSLRTMAVRAPGCRLPGRTQPSAARSIAVIVEYGICAIAGADRVGEIRERRNHGQTPSARPLASPAAARRVAQNRAAAFEARLPARRGPAREAEVLDERPTRGASLGTQRHRAARSESRSRDRAARAASAFCASGTKIARIDPWRGLSENSPRSSRGETWRTVRRTLRPTSSFRPCSDSVGIADALSTRRTTDARRRRARGKPLLSSASLPPGALHARGREAPEPIVDGVHLHARRAAPALLSGDEPFEHDQRHGRARTRPPAARGRIPATGRRDRRAEPLQHQVAQARAHRYADHQRAGQHRDRDGDAGDDGEIRAPVVAQASAEEGGWRSSAVTPRAAACDRPARSGWETARRARRCA